MSKPSKESKKSNRAIVWNKYGAFSIYHPSSKELLKELQATYDYLKSDTPISELPEKTLKELIDWAINNTGCHESLESFSIVSLEPNWDLCYSPE